MFHNSNNKVTDKLESPTNCIRSYKVRLIVYSKQFLLGLGLVVHTLIPELRMWRQMDFFKFKPSCSRVARAI